MQDIWNKDPEAWRKFSITERLFRMRSWHCTGPCGQTQAVIGARDALRETLINATIEIVKAREFRDEVLAALIECQDHDRLRKRLMELIERTAKPQRVD